MISYELAKQLKDAGFPQTGHGLFWIDGYNVAQWLSRPQDHFIRAYVPTLSELIEACGEKFVSLYKDGDGWRAHGKAPLEADCHDDDCCGDLETGMSAEEALAHLWLALNKK